MLGSLADAEDAVQDTGLTWLAYDGPPLRNATAWLTRVCTNRCLDMLKSGSRKRVDYVGPWLPDYLQTEFEVSPEERLEVASSLTTAFLLLLQRLTPKERAAYLLHDIFGKSFQDVAGILNLQPANCRQLAARARGFVAQANVRHVLAEERQTDLLLAFQTALETGDITALGALLTKDADLRADSGGKAVALHHVLSGREEVCDFVAGVLCPAWSGSRLSSRTINGSLGLIVESDRGLEAAVTFGLNRDGAIRNVFILRHPDKLRRLVSRVGKVESGGSLHLLDKPGRIAAGVGEGL